MGDEYLRKLFERMSPAELNTWHQRKVLAARYIRSRLVRLSRMVACGVDETYLEMPQADEIVAETVSRVLSKHSERYVWDGRTPFDRFFGACMKTTANGLRSVERNHRRGQDKLDPRLRAFFQDPLPDHREVAEIHDNRIAERQGVNVLASAIATTGLMGTIVRYAERLPIYADAQSTTEEIAADLGVKPGSIDPYRHRLRKVLKKSTE